MSKNFIKYHNHTSSEKTAAKIDELVSILKKMIDEEELSEADWDRMFAILRGQKHSADDFSIENLEKWYENYDGTGILSWWD